MIEFTDQELHSVGMTKVRTYLKECLADARKSNDKDLTEIQTAALRGRIRFIKQMDAAISDTKSK